MSTSNINGRNRFPFTVSQWQELERQALIFKYMVTGLPIPPDLLFTIKRSCFDPPLSLSPKLFPHQHQHMGSWNCFQIGLGRKIDPEPGRCRRTDGKKWRCSKEAYPDSKYCERHMHRGKNRSRKPVEVELTATAAAATTPSTQISSLTQNSSHNSLQHQLHSPAYNNSHLDHSFFNSSKPQETLNLNSSNHLVLDSGSGSRTNADYRYVYGLKEEIDEHAFFSEPSGSIRSFSGSSMDDSWQFTPLAMSSSSSSSSSSKQRSCSGLQGDYSYLQLQSLKDHNPKQQDKQDQHCFVLGSEIKSELPLKLEREPQKTVHRFFDEWPPKTRDSWLDLDDKSSNTASISRTSLSISIPSSHDFPIFSSRAP